MLEKVTTMKRFEYSLLGKKLKTQTDIARKQYERLNNLFKFDTKEASITIQKEKQTIKQYKKSYLTYNSKHSFYKYYHDSKKFTNLSFNQKYSFQSDFFIGLNKFNEIKKKKQKCMMQLQNYVLNY